MKLLIFILGISLCFSFPTLGGYQSLDTETAASNDEIKSCIQTGLETIIQDAQNNGKTYSSNFSLTKINSVQKKTSTGVTYKFNCQFDNDEDTTIVASFEVYKDQSQQTVASYSYDVSQTTVVDRVKQSFTECSSEQIQYSSEIQDAINYGVNEVVQKSIQSGSLPQGSYSVSKINSVYRQIVDSALFYKCSVDLQGDGGAAAEATFTVYYQPFLGDKSTVDYSCTVKGGENSHDTDNAPAYTSEELMAPVEDEWSPVPVGDAENDDMIRELVDYGGSQISEIAASNNNIPSDASLQVEDVNEAYSQVVGNGIFYKFTCKFGSGENVKVTSTFTVYYQIDTQQKSLVEYSYESSTIQTGHSNIDDANTDMINEEYIIHPNGEDEIPLYYEEEELFGGIPIILPDFNEEEQFVPPEVDEDGFTLMSPLQVEENAVLSALFQFGFETVIEKGKKKSKIPDTDFFVSSISGVRRKNDNNGELYRFECEADDHEGSMIQMNFTVYYDYSSARKALSSYSFHISTNGGTTHTLPLKPIDAGYTPCGQEEIQGNTIQNVLKYAAGQIYQIAFIQGKIPISLTEYSVSQITSISKQETVKGTYYKCQVILKNSNQIQIEANFIACYESESQQTSLSEYDFTVKDLSVPTTPVEQSDKPDTDDSADDEYKNLDLSEVQNSEEIQDIMNYGLKQMIETGNKKGKIPEGDYSITKILKVSSKKDNKRYYYKFEVEIEDDKGKAFIEATYTVTVIISNGERDLKQYSYHIEKSRKPKSQGSDNSLDNTYVTIPKEECEYNPEIGGLLWYGIEEIVPNYGDYIISVFKSCARKVVKSSLYYKFEVELSNQKGKTVKLGCTVQYKPDVGIKDIKSYSYNIHTKTSSSSSSSSSTSYKYSQKSTSTIRNSSKYQNILNYGAQQCAQKLYESNILPNPSFTLTETYSVFTQNAKDGENCRFKVKMEQIDIGISLNVNINVYYNSRNGDKQLTSYTVEGSSSGHNEVVVVDYSNNNQGQQTSIQNCQHVDEEEVNNNYEVEEAIDYGVQEVVKEVTKKEKINRKDFKVKEVKNVYREVNDSQNYRVEATLENSRGQKIDCSFSVNSQSDKKQLNSYSYITY